MILAALVASLTLLGYLNELEPLYRPLPGRVASHEVMAGLLLALALALGLTRPGAAGPVFWVAIAACLGVSLLDLVQPAQFCHGTAPGAARGICFGRNSAAMAGLLALAAAALRLGWQRAAQGIALLAAFPAVVAATGLSFGIGECAGDMSVMALIGGLLLVAGIAAETRCVGMVSALAAPGEGATIGRAPLLLAVPLVYLLGLVMRSLSRDPDVSFWLALFTVAAGYGVLGLLVWTQARLRRLDRDRLALHAAMQAMALSDPLTGLANRRALDRTIRETFDPDPGKSAAVLFVDADEFKAVNDRHGHEAGDRALIHIAGLMRRVLPCEAELARLGGEEFLAVLPGSSEAEARCLAEALRRTVAETALVVRSGEALALTVSIGVALRGRGEPLWQVIDAADRALYDAKLGGRNAVAEARRA